MTTQLTRLCCAATAMAAAGVLVSCSGFGPTHSHVSSAVIKHFKGLPNHVSVPIGQRMGQHQRPWAAWAGSRTIYVMTWGSGSCPKIPTSVEMPEANTVVINTVEHDFYSGDDACTADLAVTTSVVRLPSSVDPTNTLVAQIDGTTTRLAPRSG